ncbi:MAG: para-aminobenzoate synthetase/4-amino-4-deoxychorismate lyase [Candidatus Azotimanducaceae bacterium]|jgi:para-aminobenzoate synthetase/4-amino-4-deoxychorismate lyase
MVLKLGSTWTNEFVKFVIKTSEPGEYYYCNSPERVIIAENPASLKSAIREIEVLQSEGYYLGGWISYEAAAALDPRQKVLSDQTFPLLTMLASRKVEKIRLPVVEATMPITSRARIQQEAYEQQCEKLLSLIVSGDVYQANFSFRTDVDLIQDPYALFCHLEAQHPVPYAAYIETDEWQVISLSPELFLKRSGRQLVSAPMKGTMARGLTFAEDEALRELLAIDIKNRAENIMIVDLMRNDFGKICETGSVQVPRLFSSQRFHSLHQLVSEVTGQLRLGETLEDILSATFPAGSITGAPKIRAMEIIEELETDGRKAYTGSVGIFEPGGDFCLNVGIRTLTCQTQADVVVAELGIGSGVVVNSEQALEWRECLLKSEFLHFRQMHTHVFETILWQGDYLWLDAHLNRLAQSCQYFLIALDWEEVMSKLTQLARSFTSAAYRVRLAVDTAGGTSIQSDVKLTPGWGKAKLKVLLSGDHVNSDSRYQYHKTDYRPVYDAAYKGAVASGFDEVLFLNQKGDLTEGAISNVFIRSGGEWQTPPVSAGLLAGVWREQFLADSQAIEKTMVAKTLQSADEVILGNSLRLAGSVGEIWFNNACIWAEKG